jgi:hypothetical protein
MRNVQAILWFSAMVSVVPVAALAEGNGRDVTQAPAARNGAERVGGVEMTSPVHASTATGQSANALSSDDTRRSRHPRNRAVLGPSGVHRDKKPSK